MFISSAIDHEFDPQGVWPITFGIRIDAASPSTALGVRAKTGLVRIMSQKWSDISTSGLVWVS